MRTYRNGEMSISLWLTNGKSKCCSQFLGSFWTWEHFQSVSNFIFFPFICIKFWVFFPSTKRLVSWHSKRQPLQSFSLVIFECCILSLKKDPTSSAPQLEHFFFKGTKKKIVICPFYIPDDENKCTCQVSHKNGIKYISRSFNILCIFL